MKYLYCSTCKAQVKDFKEINEKHYNHYVYERQTKDQKVCIDCGKTFFSAYYVTCPICLGSFHVECYKTHNWSHLG